MARAASSFFLYGVARICSVQIIIKMLKTCKKAEAMTRELRGKKLKNYRQTNDPGTRQRF